MTSLTINLHGPIYKAFRYPAGETQVRILPEHVPMVQKAEEIRVIARISNAEDIIELAMLCDAIEGVSECGWLSIVLPYLPYARADRRFTQGDCFGLQAFGALLASMAPNRVVTLDAHSDKAFNYIPELTNVSAMPLIHEAIIQFSQLHMSKEICVLFPDAGARDRYSLPREIGNNLTTVWLKVLNASKGRNVTTGEFLGFEVPAAEEFDDLPTLIVDDLCDGGGTFMGIGGLLPSHIKLGLYVTHGIFSKGVGALMERFDHIWTTDTFYDGRFGKVVTTLDASPLLLRAASQAHELTLREMGG